jgi:DNA-damage-inducible protein D
MDRLKAARRESVAGSEFWMASDVFPILGYSSLRKFMAVIERATDALRENGLNSSHHIALAGSMMGNAGGSPPKIIISADPLAI